MMLSKQGICSKCEGNHEQNEDRNERYRKEPMEHRDVKNTVSEIKDNAG